MLPLLGFRALRRVPKRRTRLPRGFRPRGVPRRVWVPVSRRPPPPLAEPEGSAASLGFRLRGLAPRVDRSSSRTPCPRVVHRVGSHAPTGSVRTRSTSGLRSRRTAVRRRTPCGARRAVASLAFSPPELPPRPSWRSLRFASPPSARVRRRDVPFRLRLEVFRTGRVGWPLSGLPALLGFSTLRPSRRREDGSGTRAHGLASPFARVAGGASGSLRPRRPSDRGFRLGPTPPSIGGRLSTSSVRQSLFSKEREGFSKALANPTAFTRSLRARGDPLTRQRVARERDARPRARPQRARPALGNHDARGEGDSQGTRPGCPCGRATCAAGWVSSPDGNLDAHRGDPNVHAISPRVESGRESATEGGEPPTPTAPEGLARADAREVPRPACRATGTPRAGCRGSGACCRGCGG
jgi:hypothetical protein